jgi:hypothetical protein
VYSVVLDTNVLVAALRSRRGASFALVSKVGSAWLPLISVPLVLEYEAIGKREAQRMDIPRVLSKLSFVRLGIRNTFNSALVARRPKSLATVTHLKCGAERGTWPDLHLVNRLNGPVAVALRNATQGTHE